MDTRPDEPTRTPLRARDDDREQFIGDARRVDATT